MDYEASLKCTNKEINVVHFCDDYLVIPEEETMSVFTAKPA